MDQNNQDLIIKLRILARIPKNGKLNLSSNDIQIYQNTWTEWIKRWKSGDGREKTIECLNRFYNQVLQTTNDIISCLNSNCDDCKDKAENLFLFAIDLANSIDGINNLCDTYVDDHKIYATIQFICRQYIAIQYLKIVDALQAYDKKYSPDLAPGIRDLILRYAPAFKKSPVLQPSTPPSPGTFKLSDVPVPSQPIPLSNKQAPSPNNSPKQNKNKKSLLAV